jgi:hypothetical protein
MGDFDATAAGAFSGPIGGHVAKPPNGPETRENQAQNAGRDVALWLFFKPNCLLKLPSGGCDRPKSASGRASSGR